MLSRDNEAASVLPVLSGSRVVHFILSVSLLIGI